MTPERLKKIERVAHHPTNREREELTLGLEQCYLPSGTLADLTAEIRRLQALLHGEVCAQPLDAPPEKHSWRCALHTNGGRGNAHDYDGEG